MTRYRARVTAAGRWGWSIEILSSQQMPGLPALEMVEVPSSFALTERGAKRRAARMILRRPPLTQKARCLS